MPRGLCGRPIRVREWKPQVITRSIRASTDDTLYFKVVYWMIGVSVPNDRMVAQHNYLNQCLTATNSALEKVPTSGQYSFASVIGNANMVVLPSNGDELSDENIKTRELKEGEEISASAPLTSCIGIVGDDIVPNVLNVFICKIPPLSEESGSILGQSQLGGNVLVVDVDTVGGPMKSGPSGNYGQGGTLVHELGHSLNLKHTWTEEEEGGCGAPQDFTDIPKSKLPNFTGELVLVDGTWTGKGDNRSHDCTYYKDNSTSGIPDSYVTDYYSKGEAMSCFDCNILGTGCTQCNDQEGEQFMNLMDYGTDAVAIMFSAQQCLAMRAWLLSAENTYIVLADSDGGGVPTDPMNQKGSSAVLPLWAIITVSSVAFIIIVTLIALYAKKGSSSASMNIY